MKQGQELIFSLTTTSQRNSLLTEQQPGRPFSTTHA